MDDTIRRVIDALRAETVKALRTRTPPNRDGIERRLQDATAAELARQKRRLLALLGDPPDPSRVPASFWDEIGASMAAQLRPIMQDIYLSYALDTLRQSGGVGVDWSLVNRRAIDWSNRYTYDMVREIDSTTRDNLDRAFSRFFETPGMTRGDLEAMITPDFGEVRAQMIAITEVTRAASEGEVALAQELRDAGVNMVATWYTTNDEKVCPLCGPLQDKEATEYIDGRPHWIYVDGDGNNSEAGPPPRHVNCRCFVGYSIPR